MMTHQKALASGAADAHDQVAGHTLLCSSSQSVARLPETEYERLVDDGLSRCSWSSSSSSRLVVDDSNLAQGKSRKNHERYGTLAGLGLVGDGLSCSSSSSSSSRLISRG